MVKITFTPPCSIPHEACDAGNSSEHAPVGLEEGILAGAVGRRYTRRNEFTEDAVRIRF